MQILTINSFWCVTKLNIIAMIDSIFYQTKQKEFLPIFI